MACACQGCTNKREYYLWLKDTVEEFEIKLPKSLQFDPYAVSNVIVDRAITRLLKLYQMGILRSWKASGLVASESQINLVGFDNPAAGQKLPQWEIEPWDWDELKRKLS